MTIVVTIISIVFAVLLFIFSLAFIAGKFYVKVGPDEAIIKERLGGLLEQFHLDSGDIKDLSVAAIIAKLLANGGTEGVRNQLIQLLGLAGTLNLADKQVGKVVG